MPNHKYSADPLLRYKSRANFDEWFKENYNFLRTMFDIANDELSQHGKELPEKHFPNLCYTIYLQS